MLGLPIDPAATITGLAAFDPVTVFQDEVLGADLPVAVPVIMSDAAVRYRLVTWDTPDLTCVDAPCVRTVGGSLGLRTPAENPAGLAPRVQVQILAPPPLESVALTAVHTVAGVAPPLPDRVPATFGTGPDAIQRHVEVQWDISPVDYETVGTHTVHGALTDYPDYPTANVTLVVNVGSPWLSALVDPRQVFATEPVTIAAAGFTGEEELVACVVHHDSMSQSCVEGLADVEGRAGIALHAPDLVPGEYEVEVRGDPSGSAFAYLTIMDKAPPTPRVPAPIISVGDGGDRVSRGDAAAVGAAPAEVPAETPAEIPAEVPAEVPAEASPTPAPRAYLPTLRVAPGARVEGRASGFAANEAVEVVLGESGPTLWSGHANELGEIAARLDIPDDLFNGTYRATFRGEMSGEARATFVINALEAYAEPVRAVVDQPQRDEVAPAPAAVDAPDEPGDVSAALMSNPIAGNDTSVRLTLLALTLLIAAGFTGLAARRRRP